MPDIVAQNIVKVGLSLSYVPVYFLLLRHLDLANFAGLIILLTYISALSVLDFGSSSSPFFGDRVFFDLSYYPVIFASIAVCAVLLPAYVDLLQPFPPAMVIIAAFLFYVSNRARIVIDLYSNDSYRLAVMRSLLPLVRWLGLYLATMLDSPVEHLLVIMVLLESLYILIIWNYYIQHAEWSEDLKCVKWYDHRLLAQWLGSLLYACADLVVRIFLVFDLSKAFIVYDILSRALFVVNILATYFVRKLREVSLSFVNVGVARAVYCFFLVIFMLSSFPFHLDYLFLVLVISILNIIYLGTHRYVELLVIKITGLVVLGFDNIFTI